VTWRNGRRSVFAGVAANTLYEIDESGSLPSPPAASTDGPFFEDASRLLDHVQVDPPFDDLARQPCSPIDGAGLDPASRG
jgi:hypothetical protein